MVALTRIADTNLWSRQQCLLNGTGANSWEESDRNTADQEGNDARQYRDDHGDLPGEILDISSQVTDLSLERSDYNLNVALVAFVLISGYE